MPKIYGSKTKTQFPKPRAVKVHDTVGSDNALKFFNYWAEIPADKVDLVKVSTYRQWPLVDLKIVEPERSTITWSILHGPIPFDSPADYKKWFKETYGSGEWRCILNEEGVSGAVMECFFSAVDLDTHPPILDLKTVLHGLERNKVYIEWLRRRNIPLPWDDPEQTQEEQEMQAQNTVATEALKIVADIGERNTKLAADIGEAKLEAARQNESASPIAIAAQESIRLMGDTTREVVSRSMESMGKQHDPIEMLKATAEILNDREKAVHSPTHADPTIALLLTTITQSNERLVQAQNQQFDLFKTIFMRPAADGSFVMASQSPVAAPRSIKDELLEIKELADILGISRPSRAVARRDHDEDEEPRKAPEKGTDWAALAPLIMTGVTTIFALGANMLHNWAVAKKGEGSPKSPDQAVREMQQQPAQQVVQQQQQPQNEAQAWAQFIQQVAPVFIKHFYDPQSSGYTFAEYIQSDGMGAGITQDGRQKYLVVREKLGEKGMLQLVKSYPDLIQKVGGLPQKLEQFIHEFMTYDEWVAEQDEEPAGAAA